MHLFSSVGRGHFLLSAALCVGASFGAAQLQPALAISNSPPTIIGQPAGGVAGLGEDFAFTVEASGTPPLTFQWFFAGSALAGETNASLLLTNLTLAQSGVYGVTVQNI